MVDDSRQPAVEGASGEKRVASNTEDVIEEAMREGVFDDLPGRGKPLKLSKNPYAAEAELAHQLLKDNDYTLPWIAERNDLLEEAGGLRAEIQEVWGRFEPEYKVARSEVIRQGLAQGWRGYLDRWQEQIDKLNRGIRDVNLKQPGGRLEMMMLTLDGELTRAEARRDL